MSFQNLADIHTGRYTQRIQHDLYRLAAGQEWHIFTRHNTGNYTLITMAACHFIAFGNLTFLSNMHTHLFIYARRQLITVFTGKYLYADNLTSLAMRHTQRTIANFTCFFTKNSTQQTFFSSQLSFTFRSNLTDKNITGTHFSTDADNTAFVKILQRFFRNVGNITGDFFLTKLGITGIAVIFFNMDRSKDIGFNQIFTQQNSILVVVAFPRHIGNNYIVAKCQFAVICCRAICKHLFFNYFIAFIDDRTLVDAGSLIRTFEFQKFININTAVFRTDTDFIADNTFNNTGTFS